MKKPNGNNESYLSAFAKKGAEADERITRALDVALDIRKFEIELYWKRAAYFWVFTGAALAGFLAALTGEHVHSRPEAMLLTSCTGFIFACAWYMVNSASKYWQSNWEAHVDLLEDAVHGPLYKIILHDSNEWWKIHLAQPFSVSKINQVLSFLVASSFLLLAAYTGNHYYAVVCTPMKWKAFPTACLIITVLAPFMLICLGATGKSRRVVSRIDRDTSIRNPRKDDSKESA